MSSNIIVLAYLVSAVLFIYGMKKLGSPSTARSGNQLSSLGMLVAVITTLLSARILTPVEMIGGLTIGALIGVYLAKKVEMTSMPELVAAFNGFGGGASALVAAAETARYLNASPGLEIITIAIAPSVDGLNIPVMATIALSIMIGTLTFSGSFVAFGKLSGKISGNPITFPGLRFISLALVIGAFVCVGMAIYGLNYFTGDQSLIVNGLIILAAISFLLGIVLVIPIGGADMPVIVALLNSYSGLAAAATGFALNNYALIVSGALVGASGLILTKIMCEAMNRSLLNVLLGGVGGDTAAAMTLPEGAADRTFRETHADDVAIMLTYAENVVVVPGYGMAVAQAQHVVRELSDILQARDVTVKYAIHPVAGRMPGHMNVLLAEANVPYDQLYDMDDINGEFDNTDVVLVIGANDVVNPAARTNTSSPIYGMPILDVDKADSVVVLKRSMRPGYSGVDNDLFYESKTAMLFGDAKESIGNLISEVKDLD